MSTFYKAYKDLNMVTMCGEKPYIVITEDLNTVLKFIKNELFKHKGKNKFSYRYYMGTLAYNAKLFGWEKEFKEMFNINVDESLLRLKDFQNFKKALKSFYHKKTLVPIILAPRHVLKNKGVI